MHHHLSIVTKVVGEIDKEQHDRKPCQLAFKSTHPSIEKIEVCAIISAAIELYSEEKSSWCKTEDQMMHGSGSLAFLFNDRSLVVHGICRAITVHMRAQRCFLCIKS